MPIKISTRKQSRPLAEVLKDKNKFTQTRDAHSTGLVTSTKLLTTLSRKKAELLQQEAQIQSAILRLGKQVFQADAGYRAANSADADFLLVDWAEKAAEIADRIRQVDVDICTQKQQRKNCLEGFLRDEARLAQIADEFREFFG
jgi:hypothetical protein